MTKLETLELGVANLEAQIAELRSKEYEIEERMEKEFQDTFSKYFDSILSDEVSIKTSRNYIYFEMKDEDRDWMKEIFSISFRETYEFKEENVRFSNASLSYYTTSTNSDFELIRLENLGRVASMFRNFKQAIVDRANEITAKYRKELNEKGFAKERYALESLVRDTNQKIKEIKKQQKKDEVFGEGLTFEKGRHVKLKSNFEPLISSLKLIDMSKSGKKVNVEYTLLGNNERSFVEENVSVDRLLADLGI
jgi:DNA-binding protein H-NS